jgi:hypothetical protein
MVLGQVTHEEAGVRLVGARVALPLDAGLQHASVVFRTEQLKRCRIAIITEVCAWRSQ